MDYIIAILLAIIAWGVTRPILKEKDERKAERLMKMLVDHHLNPPQPYVARDYPISQKEINWLIKKGKLPNDFGT